MTVTYAHLTFLEYTASGTVITVSDYPHAAGEMPVCLVAWKSGNAGASLNSVVMSGNAFTPAIQAGPGGVTNNSRAAIFYLASAPGAAMTTQVVLTFAAAIQEAKVYILGVVGHGDTPFDSAGATEGSGGAATMGTVSAARAGGRTYSFAIAGRQNTPGIVMTPISPLSTIRFDGAAASGSVAALLAESPQVASGVTERVMVWSTGGKYAMALINIQGKLPVAPMLHHYIMQVGAR